MTPQTQPASDRMTPPAEAVAKLPDQVLLTNRLGAALLLSRTARAPAPGQDAFEVTAQISAEDLDGFIRGLQVAGNIAGHAGLARVRVLHSLGLLKALLADRAGCAAYGLSASGEPAPAAREAQERLIETFARARTGQAADEGLVRLVALLHEHRPRD